MICIVVALFFVGNIWPMAPYLFPEKEQFPEHNNFFMPLTNDLSYVPRNIGKIGVENDLAVIKNQTNKIQDALKSSQSLANSSSASAGIHQGLERIFYDQDLAQPLTFYCDELSLADCLRIISLKTGIALVADHACKDFVYTCGFDQKPVGHILQYLALQHDPRLAMVKQGQLFHLLPYEKAIEFIQKTSVAKRESVVIPIKHARVDDNFVKKIQQTWDKINSLQADPTAYMHVDVDEKKIFARGCMPQLDELRCYLKEIDEPLVLVRIDAILVIAEKNFNFELGFDWSGIYNRQQTIAIKKPRFDFYGLGGTLMDFPTPDKPVVNPPNRQQATNIFVDPLNFALNLFNSGIPFLTGDRAGQNVPGAIRLPFVFGGPDLSLARLNIVLNAAEIDAKLKIVSRPSVLTSNNEVAKLLIGKSIPLQTTIEDLSTSSTRNITTINFKDVGTMIEVKPTISPDKKSVFLDILIEDSAVTSGSTKTNQQGILIDPPTVSVVKVKNRVQLKNGQTTIIGGLSYQAATESRNMVPWLWKIPLLGYLFQATFSSNQDKERYIFLTPTIIIEH